MNMNGSEPPPTTSSASLAIFKAQDDPPSPNSPQITLNGNDAAL